VRSWRAVIEALLSSFYLELQMKRYRIDAKNRNRARDHELYGNLNNEGTKSR
jgi:hypothetical protein